VIDLAHNTQSTYQEELLTWYSRVKRSLPWRDLSHDAYAVWVSEIMLQQTTVATVIPFFKRWMLAFPTVSALAAADIEDVLRHWSGLGYYARARNLKKAAQIVLDEHGGRVPDTVVALTGLPGIGRYTAGAIASIAYGHPEAVLDANVIRVLTRLHAIKDYLELSAAKDKLWRLAAEAIPRNRASDFNQAMMELGALVCLPAAPRCSECPVRRRCAAYAMSEQVLYPRTSKVTRWVNVVDCCVAVQRDDNLLFVRRPESGVWGGLWELPRATTQDDELLNECAVRAVSESVGIKIDLGQEFGRWKHTVMNSRITLHGYLAVPTRDQHPEKLLASISGGRVAWMTAADAVAKLPLPSPQHAILEQWRVARNQPALALDK